MKKNVLSLVFVFVFVVSFFTFTTKTFAGTSFLTNLFNWGKQESSLGYVFVGVNLQSSGKVGITVPADLNTFYANGATETNEYLIVPSTTGFIQIDKKTGLGEEGSISGQIVDVVKISDTLVAFLRRSEKYAYSGLKKPKTEINNVIFYNVKDSHIVKTVELGSEDTHLANNISISDDKKHLMAVLSGRDFGSAGKVLSVNIDSYEVKEVFSSMGDIIRCGESQLSIFLCKMGGGVVPFSKKTLTAGQEIATPSETQGYVSAGTFEYFTLFQEKKIVRREIKTGKIIEIPTSSYPRAVFIDREKNVIFISSDDGDFLKDSWWKISSFTSGKAEKIMTSYGSHYFIDTK